MTETNPSVFAHILDQSEDQGARAAVESRFFTSIPPREITDGAKHSLSIIRASVLELAVAIERHVPNGRDKSLALTHLEDVLMRANRGVFA